MDTVLYMEINIFSIAVLLVIAVKSSVPEISSSFKSRVFSASVWFALAANVFDSLWKISVTQHIILPTQLILGVNFMYFMCFGFSSYFWFLYSEAIAKINLQKRRLLMFLEMAPLVILAGLLVTSMFNGCVFYFDGCMEYHRGPLFYLQATLSYGYIGVASIMNIIRACNKKNYAHKDELFAAALFAVPLILCGIMQMVFQKAPIMTMGVSVSFMAVYISSLQMLVSIDPLTGIGNRYSLLRYLEEKMLATKKGQSLYFLFLDMDLFKQINDSYGHSEGDRALKTVADALKYVCRQYGGFCARYGGDEFAIVQIQDGDYDIDKVQTRIHNTIKQKCIEESLPYDINVSIGYAEYPKQADNIQDLISCADDSMYDSKTRFKKSAGKTH